MTLKTRNTFLKVFFLGSIAEIACMLILFIVSILKQKFITPPELRIPDFLQYLPFLKSDVTAVMISFAVLFIYVPLCFYLLIRIFENTQTSEIIFFTGFLFSCLAESARFITICLGLWLSFSNMLIFAGKIVLFGRTMAPLSFLCAAILSETSQRQDTERNYIIMVMFSVVFAAVIPMNTARIASTGLVTEGFMPLINTERLLLFITVILSFLIQAIKKNSVEHKKLASSSCLLLLGYSLLVSCDNFIFLILGTAGLVFGTYRYLTNLHRLYMWS